MEVFPQKLINVPVKSKTGQLPRAPGGGCDQQTEAELGDRGRAAGCIQGPQTRAA